MSFYNNFPGSPHVKIIRNGNWFYFVECELKKFGNNCTETCNCVNQPCDHITGVCPPGGCLRGYTRSDCSTGK